MCGIIGCIGNTNSIFIKCYNGLKMLQNRGYDSAGVCSIISGSNFLIHKYASAEIPAIQFLKKHENEHKDSQTMIMHCRWATHGEKTDENAHPHVDYKNRFAVVHNGIIENYDILKKNLEDDYNILFKSGTDTEVIVNLISIYYDKTKNVKSAITNTIKQLCGTWGIVIIFKDEPEKLYCTRHGSPLLIGIGTNFLMVSSEKSGFCNTINNYFCLENNEIVTLKKDKHLSIINTNRTFKLQTLNKINLIKSPDPYPHWTLKEINDQVDVSLRSINIGGRIDTDSTVKLGGLENHIDQLLLIDNLIILACGTSYYSGMYSMKCFKEISGFNTVQIFDGAEFTENDIPLHGITGFILISQSGETKDLHRCLKFIDDYVTIGIINVVDSMIAREVTCGCYLNAGREYGVASTKAFTSQVIVLHLVAIWFSQNRNLHELKRKTIIKDIRRLPQNIKFTIDSVHGITKDIANYLKTINSCFILGKGQMVAVAKEGSLKIKEIGYIHAEGYSSSALKHGTFALLTNKTPVIVLNTNDLYTTKINNAIEEVSARGSPIINITDIANNKKYNYTIFLPTNKTFKGLIAIIPLQLIAYELALIKGHNPDFPRNLAKVVTTE